LAVALTAGAPGGKGWKRGHPVGLVKLWFEIWINPDFADLPRRKPDRRRIERLQIRDELVEIVRDRRGRFVNLVIPKEDGSRLGIKPYVVPALIFSDGNAVGREPLYLLAKRGSF